MHEQIDSFVFVEVPEVTMSYWMAAVREPRATGNNRTLPRLRQSRPSMSTCPTARSAGALLNYLANVCHVNVLN